MLKMPETEKELFMKKFGKFIALFLILTFSTISTFAFVVSAPAVEAQLAILNGKTTANQVANQAKWVESIQKAVQIYNTAQRQLTEAKNAIEQGKQQFSYWKEHAGNWQAIVARVRTGATTWALEQGTFCGTPNMGAGDLFPGESSVQGLARAVEEAKKLLAGRQSSMTPSDLRNVVTRIIGKIPETENAGVSVFAQTSIEDDIAFLARANKAITELQGEMTRIRAEREGKIRAGFFTEADKTQYEMSEKDISGQIQTLQLQTLVRVNQQLVVSNSFRVKAQNDLERKRIEAYNLQQAQSSLLGK